MGKLGSHRKSSLSLTVREKTVGYITAALGLVAGLAWNEAIKALIEVLFPLQQNSLWAKFAYAVLVTLVVVVAGTYVARLSAERAER